MKQILNRPLLLALILTLPLWIAFNNFIVAIIVALLLSFLLSMYNALRVLRRKRAEESEPETPGDSP